jgi:YidC/Oxa1 family membrane protein insertase
VTIEKRLLFTRGSYTILVEQTLDNGSSEPWRGDQYTQLLRRSKGVDRSMFDVDSYSFDGPQTYNGDKAEKYKRDDLLEKGPVEFSTPDGWVAAIQHHFLSAIVPESGAPHVYRVDVKGDTMIASVVGAKRTVEPGATETFSRQLFVGPKIQSQLEDLHERLKLTVDYGWLTILSQPMFWLLGFIHDYVGNWGVSIILVTMLIKLAFYKMTETSGRSMAKMRNLQPRIKALQERYKDDKQQLSQQMMDLYKREKVNPAAGCLPILIQMPFFLAFYWVLIESVEMRQAPFMLWITDLSTRDPYFILPLIMGAAMLLQQKLNPAPADPVQARVMQIMPIMFTGFFAFFPSGLVLYWATNTVLSIAQQWKINKVVEKEEKSRKSGKKKKPKS